MFTVTWADLGTSDLSVSRGVQERLDAFWMLGKENKAKGAECRSSWTLSQDRDMWTNTF